MAAKKTKLRSPDRRSGRAPARAAGHTASRAAGARRYWLFKSEPGSYGWEQFVRDGRTFWSGVRNYQARNLLRDEVQVGDGVLFYHSNADPTAIVGVAKVVRAGYPDPTQFDPASPYHDADSDPAAPRWFVVDVEPVVALPRPLSRDELKDMAALADMVLLQRGSRLWVQPVTAAEWRAILDRADVEVTF